MKQFYTVKVNTSSYNANDILNEIKECVSLFSEIGYPELKLNTYQVDFSTKTSKTLAYCTKLGINSYKIVVNKHYLELASPEHFHSTIAHEVLHSVKGGMNHGPIWKAAAQKVNERYNFYPITRTSRDKNYWENYGKFHSRKSNINYIIECSSCHHKWEYYREGKVVKATREGRTSCPYCGNKNLKLY